ncbi:MAG: STAS/SEC14 domain-containing protein [Gaiellales bacterium]
MAIVSDADWLHKAVHGLGWMMPGGVKAFELRDVDQAKEWVTS